MPYPLENLQYGLRRRLRELATPAEAYDLQIAAPYYCGFQPLQKVQIVPYARFTRKKNNVKKVISWNGVHVDTNETMLYIASKTIAFDLFTKKNHLIVTLNNFRFSPHTIYFYNCRLSTTFVQLFLKALNGPIKQLDLYPCSFTSENAVKMICNAPAFKSLKSFTTLKPADSSLNTWIKVFAESESIFLREFNVFDASVSVFKIDKDVFFKFFKAQPDNFVMNFHMYEETKPERVADVLKNLFGGHFECGEGDYSRKKKIVNIRLKLNLRLGYTLRVD